MTLSYKMLLLLFLSEAADTGWRVWARIERMKPEGLGGSRCNHFPDIDSHSQAQQLQFIHQRDVNAAVNVFEELRHFRHRRRRDGDGTLKDAAVNRARG